jgi:hypothetical protein
MTQNMPQRRRGAELTGRATPGFARRLSGKVNGDIKKALARVALLMPPFTSLLGPKGRRASRRICVI